LSVVPVPITVGLPPSFQVLPSTSEMTPDPEHAVHETLTDQQTMMQPEDPRVNLAVFHENIITARWARL
jgi:hypothetical protein